MRLRSVLAGAAVALSLAAPAPASAHRSHWHRPHAHAASCSSAQDRLSANKAAVEVTCLPYGTSHIGVAYMPSLSSGSSAVKYFSVSTSTRTIRTPNSADPVLDVQAWASSRPIGSWAGRKQTVPGGVTPPPPPPAPEPTPVPIPTPLPEPTPIPAPSTLALGINAGGWGASTEVPDILRLGGVVRLDSPSGSLAAYESKGIRVIADLSGPYDHTNGVSGVNVAAYVERVLALVRSNPSLYAVEVLNEPGGNWFWGEHSESPANRESYAHLLIDVHTALVANFGSHRPLELCSFDGGHLDSDAWGEAWERVPGALEACDGVTNHPYGGTGERSKAILGRRSSVERTEELTHKPVFITEVGFPTAGPTSDSLKYTEAEQAQACTGFVSWARSTGYVAAVTFFGYRDEKEGGGYGVETHSGAHKLAYAALEAASH